MLVTHNKLFSSPSTALTIITRIASVALLAFTIAACNKPEAPSNGPRPALAYKIRGDAATKTDAYSGDIRARHEADHAFRVGGKIVKRLVDVGASVTRGQVLAQIDAQDVTLAADAARAQVAALNAEADFADAELKRFRDLFAKGFVSQSALDQKLNVSNAAKARLHAQQAQSTLSQNQAGYATLVAEMNGVVTQVFAEAGQVVSAGQAVLRVANPAEKELAISIPESLIAEFNARRKDALVAGLWSNPDQIYPARVREVGAAADPITRTYPARISLPAADATVQLGMSGFVAFSSARNEAEVSIPLSALYSRDRNIGVWRIAADGRVSLLPVTVIKYTETAAIVKSMLKVGDVIVAAGVHKLRDGDIVKPLIDPVVTGDGKVAIAAPIAEIGAVNRLALKKRFD